MAIVKEPEFSLSYWVLAQLYYKNGNDHEGAGYERIAIEKNPLLKDISFEKATRQFVKRSRTNPFLKDLPYFIDLIRPANNPQPVSPYAIFSIIKENEKKGVPGSINLELALQAYYLNPVLGRSIFDSAVRYLIRKKDSPLALEVSRMTKNLKPEYSTREQFSQFESQILNQFQSNMPTSPQTH